METLRKKSCPNSDCQDFGKVNGQNIIDHASFKSQSGRKQRCLCKTCGTTFSANTGTAYFGLRCTREEFDHASQMRVEGLSISAIARITGRSRTTIAHWLERAAIFAKNFNNEHLRHYEIKEIQADELCTFVGKKSTQRWIFTATEVSSRLWLNSIVGRRSYQNTKLMFNEVLFYARNPTHPILVTTDGFQFYEKAVRRVLDVLCVHGQVIKTRRNNRVIRVDRQLKIGTKARLAELLLESEDSETLNTSFVERLNLTIRQGSAYLQRRSPCHARYDRTLKEHMDLLMCYFNFLRPHRGLKFGKEIRTPAMEAGLTKCRLSFRVVFLGKNFCVLFAMVINLPQATIQSTHKQIFNPKISLRYHKAA